MAGMERARVRVERGQAGEGKVGKWGGGADPVGCLPSTLIYNLRETESLQGLGEE